MLSQIQRVETRIVVGMDLTENGDEALREAMRLLRKARGGELHIVYVIATPSTLHSAKRIEELSSELRARIDDLAIRVTAVRGVNPPPHPRTDDISLHIRLGDPAHALHQVAIDVDADLIVVSSHGRRGLPRWVHGSVAETLSRIAHVPICIARPKNFSNLKRSDRPDAPGPITERPAPSLSERRHATYPPRSWHVGGLL